MFLLPLAASHKLKVSSIAENNLSFAYMTYRNDLDLTHNPPPWRLILLIPEDAVQAGKARKHSILLPRWDTCEPQQWSIWKDVPKGITVVTYILAVPNSYLTEFKACSSAVKSCLVLTQLPTGKCSSYPVKGPSQCSRLDHYRKKRKRKLAKMQGKG